MGILSPYSDNHSKTVQGEFTIWKSRAYQACVLEASR